MNLRTARSLRSANMFLLLLLFVGAIRAQNIATVTLPDAPGTAAVTGENEPTPLNSSSSVDANLQAGGASTQQTPQTASSTPPADPQAVQTKRILGIFPNFRSVSSDVHLPPQTVKEKFITASKDSFDYSAIFVPAAVAGFSQAINSTPEFGQGAAGYGRYFWHTFVDQTSENYFVEFIVPSITHQDTRFYTLGHGGFLKRSGYALSRVVITRTDAGNETFNTSEVVGAGAAAGVSNLYYPSPERTFGNTAQKWGTNIGIDAATFLFREFWPDVNRALFHTKD
jgi:hypothetical protein